MLEIEPVAEENTDMFNSLKRAFRSCLLSVSIRDGAPMTRFVITPRRYLIRIIINWFDRYLRIAYLNKESVPWRPSR
jgi:hypothetical protein